MIVGNGLIAQTIKSCDNDNVILFASGVSNSVNPTTKDFEREKALLSKHLDSNKKIVYFSTISVYDDSVNTKAYIKHKLAMENLIGRTSQNYLILRLPNIIGENGNPNTLFPFFKKCLEADKPVDIKENAYRYLLTTQQLCTMLHEVLDEKGVNLTINCVLKEPYRVLDIYLALAQILNISPKHTLVSGGLHYVVPSNFDFQLQEPKSLQSLIQSEVLQPIN